MYSADMDVGQDDHVISQRNCMSSRTKLLSSLRILGMDKDTAHWEERLRMVEDALVLSITSSMCCTLLSMARRIWTVIPFLVSRISFLVFYTVKNV
jgi:hypothetical protein